ncbi:MAG: SRPBCC family protein [Chloroflexi bacterium]|nr:SRPBCC family protein [Chloroflexota bacterium]
MTTLRHQVRIDAPIEAVWQALADLVAVERYNPMVASARVISELHEGVGATRRCELKPKGWVEERVWDWAPPTAIGIEVAASEWPVVFMKWRTELTPDGGATQVNQVMHYKVKFGPLGAIMDALMMRPRLDKSIGEIFGNLKRYAEGARS